MALYLYINCSYYKTVKEEYEMVLDYLLSHTMGQTFNTRLTAQFLALKLYKSHKEIVPTTKYDYTMSIIERTFEDSHKEKSYVKLQQDFIINYFDIINYLKPQYLYHYLPQYYGMKINEVSSLNLLPKTEECIDYIERNCREIGVSKLWLDTIIENDEDLHLKEDIRKDIPEENDNADMIGTIQKKYIPWRNMSDIDVCSFEKNVSSIQYLW